MKINTIVKKVLSVVVITVFLISCMSVMQPVQVNAATYPPTSTFFSSVSVEGGPSYKVFNADGDLWPSCWADDDAVYTANGDGTGFGSAFGDIVMNKITGGSPETRDLSGIPLTSNVSQCWAGTGSNRKPTGMICVGGILYAAVQDLTTDFNHAYNATICKSTDHGQTWTWNTSAPMFNNSVFTTIFFADYGKNNGYAVDNYVYAYGIDTNWREQNKLYLARVPNDQIMVRASWQFYTGDLNGNASWSSDINARQPVLWDDTLTNGSFKAISQGGVVYNKPFNRYIYSSWSNTALRLYESPTPYGPWKVFFNQNYGAVSGWNDNNAGGYGTNIPSKWISSDGKTMWLNTNWFEGYSSYYYSLRRISLNGGNTLPGPGTEDNQVLNTGFESSSNSPWTFEGTGGVDRNLGFAHGGANNAWCRSSSGWNAVKQTINVKPNTNYTLRGWMQTSSNNNAGAFGVRTTGGTVLAQTTYGNLPSYTEKVVTFNSGSNTTLVVFGGMTSTGDTWVRFDDISVLTGNVVQNRSFENGATGWTFEGNGGIDAGGWAHSGYRNAFVRYNSGFVAVKQTINVTANTNYTLRGWVQTSGNSDNGYFGVRNSGGGVLAEAHFRSIPSWSQLSVTFNSGSNTSVTVFGGVWTDNGDIWAQFDDISVTPTNSGTPALANTKSSTNNLAQTGTGRGALYTADHMGNALSKMTDGNKTNSNDSWEGILKSTDYWGISFDKNYGFNKVVYTTGNMFVDGGWFSSGLKVQVMQFGVWKDVSNMSVSPAYPYNNTAGPNKSYTFTFSDTWGSAIRVVGTPVRVSGYNCQFTSIGELEAYYQ